MELVNSRGVPAQADERRWYDKLKRAVDVVGSVSLLLCAAPALALCAIAIWLDSPGPILFRQDRVGVGGRIFSMLKFRSMRADADPRVHRAYAAGFIKGRGKRYEAEDGARYKLVADSRVTQVGRWLRRTSLDEFPQLWNVLRGDMSLVGPRPPIPYELENYRPRHFERLAVKPGITGLWQVGGRSATTFDRMVELDLKYIESRTLALDLEILVKTIPIVLFAHNGT